MPLQTPDGVCRKLTACLTVRKKSGQLLFEFRCVGYLQGAALAWLAVDKESFSGRMLERPQRTSIPIAAQEQLVVELYSK